MARKKKSKQIETDNDASEALAAIEALKAAAAGAMTEEETVTALAEAEAKIEEEQQEPLEEEPSSEEMSAEDSPSASEPLSEEISIEADAPDSEEAAADAAPIDEAELLAIAQREGLDDSAQAETAAEIRAAEKALEAMPEAQQFELMAAMETVLFMSDKPITLARLRSTIDTDVKIAAYRGLMRKLREEFNKEWRGIEIAEVSMGYQLRTKPLMANVLRKMVKTQPLRLSGTNLEVLAMVAYKQPLTKDEIDQLRGVDSGYVLRTLMEKRLVRIVGRSDLPGRPMLYATTHEFLELFSLKDLSSLPPLHEVEAMVAASEVGFEEKAQAVMDDFGEMVRSNTKVLFDDSQIDTELEALRNEIASISTSTDYIERQKHKEKLEARFAELAAQGLMMDLHGNEVPIGTIEPVTVDAILDAKYGVLVERLESAESGLEDTPVSEIVEAAAEAMETAQLAPAIEDLASTAVDDVQLTEPASASGWDQNADMITEAISRAQAEAQVSEENMRSAEESFEAAVAEESRSELDSGDQISNSADILEEAAPERDPEVSA